MCRPDEGAAVSNLRLELDLFFPAVLSVVQRIKHFGWTLMIFPNRDLNEVMRSPVLGDRTRYSGLRNLDSRL